MGLRAERDLASARAHRRPGWADGLCLTAEVIRRRGQTRSVLLSGLVTPGLTFLKPQTARFCGTNFKQERSSSVESPPAACGDAGAETARRVVLGDGKPHSVPR